MSGPTWLPPRTVDSPERAIPQMSHSAASAIYRAPNKKGAPDFRPKYSPYDQNGGGGVATRYMATGPTGKTKLHQFILYIQSYLGFFCEMWYCHSLKNCLMHV